MSTDLSQYALTAAQIGIVIAFVQLLKTAVLKDDTPNWIIVVSALGFALLWGFLLNVAMAQGTLASNVIAVIVANAVLVWLSAMGAWSGIKASVGYTTVKTPPSPPTPSAR